jgi:hypothetical protein
MTKRELVEFLQPFDDDIKIVRFGLDHRPEDGFLFMDARPHYRMGDRDVKDVSQSGIEQGEGYILID